MARRAKQGYIFAAAAPIVARAFGLGAGRQDGYAAQRGKPGRIVPGLVDVAGCRRVWLHARPAGIFFSTVWREYRRAAEWMAGFERAARTRLGFAICEHHHALRTSRAVLGLRDGRMEARTITVDSRILCQPVRVSGKCQIGDRFAARRIG